MPRQKILLEDIVLPATGFFFAVFAAYITQDIGYMISVFLLTMIWGELYLIRDRLKQQDR
jgi:hypothetical protein